MEVSAGDKTKSKHQAGDGRMGHMAVLAATAAALVAAASQEAGVVTTEMEHSIRRGGEVEGVPPSSIQQRAPFSSLARGVSSAPFRLH